MGDMDFDKYVQAFQFLHVDASVEEMRKSFDRIDTNRSGYIDESEFLASMVPDVDTNDYNLRNQLMVLENKLEGNCSALKKNNKMYLHCNPNIFLSSCDGIRKFTRNY